MFENVENIELLPNIFLTVFIYNEFETESHRNTQNNNLYHKTHQHQTIVSNSKSVPNIHVLKRQPFKKIVTLCLFKWHFKYSIYYTTNYCLGDSTVSCCIYLSPLLPYDIPGCPCSAPPRMSSKAQSATSSTPARPRRLAGQRGCETMVIIESMPFAGTADRTDAVVGARSSKVANNCKLWGTPCGARA